MLAILTSHPIQYQVPIWRVLGLSGRVPFEVWFLTDHGVKTSSDVGFGKDFAWDTDLLGGYPHRFLKVNSDWNLRNFRGIRLHEDLAERMENAHVRALWIEGWRFSAFWKALGAAKRSGASVWMRGESNDLKHDPPWKRLIKRTILGRHFKCVDRFLCIGGANRRLYASFGIAQSKMFGAPYCVDNDNFARQAAVLQATRDELRARWRVPSDAFCFLFCGKFISKKRPADIVQAAKKMLRTCGMGRPVHLLFVGSGQLGSQLRCSCRVAFDVEGLAPAAAGHRDLMPNASFAGFLNQSKIAEAYVAADALVLPSNSGETWGLVVNEAMACGIPAVVSNQCGCAEDLPVQVDKRLVFRCGEIDDLARAMQFALRGDISSGAIDTAIESHHLRHTVRTVEELYRGIVG